METLCELKSCVKIPGEEAKCECAKACSDDYQPVCGSDNKTHVNLCNLKLESCRTNKQIQVACEGVCKVDLCAAVSCGFYSKCEVVDGSAKCVCDKACTEEFNPKCGSDGVMYTNPCELRRASCEQMKIIVATDGKCNSTINGNVRTGKTTVVVKM